MTAVLHRFPALASLMIQAAALIAASLITVLWEAAMNEGGKTWLLSALQGLVAALLSRACRQEPWWILIHAAFPMSVAGVSYLDLPDWFFLAGFVFFASLFWTTFRTRVPFYPSGPKVWQAVLNDLPGAGLCIADVGSGVGGFILHVAQARPDCCCIGIEVAPLPWGIASLRAAFRRSAARFHRKAYEAVDFGQFDVVFAYLSPAAMPDLWAKASAEMRAGTRLYSFEFSIPGVVAADVTEISGSTAVLYRFNIPANCGAKPSDCKIRHRM